MKTREIIKDALKYPVSDWKKIFILGVIVVISAINSIVMSLGVISNNLIMVLVFIGFITGFFVNGYIFRTIKTSLEGQKKPPKFNNWIEMGTEGVKLFLVFITYLVVPLVLIFLLVVLLFGSDSLNTFFTYMSYDFQTMGISPVMYLVSEVLPVIESLIGISINILQASVIYVLLYILLITPLMMVAIANMAYENEFKSAFRLNEILDEIADIGWINLIKWYITTGFIFLILLIAGNILSYLLSFINFAIILVLVYLILIPYSYMFYARALALFYKPD
jgi:hypothetical protein